MEPTMPPMTPAPADCGTSRPAASGRYSLNLMRKARDGQSLKPDGAGTHQLRQETCPSPPKIMFLMPGTMVIWNETEAWNAPT